MDIVNDAENKWTQLEYIMAAPQIDVICILIIHEKR